MSDPYFQQLFADRIGGANYGKGTAIYKFEKIKRAKRKALADHPERRTDRFRHRRKRRNGPAANPRRDGPRNRPPRKPRLRRQRHRRLSARRSARFMQRNFGVELDPAKEINHCIGSKTALAMLPAAFINPGDITLMTVPGYPVAGTHTQILRRLGPRAAAVGPERLSARPGVDSRRCARAGQAAGVVLSQQSDRQGGHARFLPPGRSTWPSGTTSWSCRTQPTSCSPTKASR